MGTSPHSGGDALQIVPQILSYRYRNECSVAFKIRQNQFPADAHPLVSWEGIPLPISNPTRHWPTSGARHASPRIPVRSTPMVTNLRFWLLQLPDGIYSRDSINSYAVAYIGSLSTVLQINVNRNAQPDLTVMRVARPLVATNHPTSCLQARCCDIWWVGEASIDPAANSPLYDAHSVVLVIWAKQIWFFFSPCVCLFICLSVSQSVCLSVHT